MKTLIGRHIPLAYEFSLLRCVSEHSTCLITKTCHQKDRGCMNDFFSEIANIRLKILTADIMKTVTDILEVETIVR